MQGSICEANARIQVLCAAIGHEAEASEDDTILIWEAISASKKGLKQVTRSSEANAEFLTQAQNTLPMVLENLAKLSGHYMINMPQINKAIEATKNQLSMLESGPGKSSDMFGFSIDADDPQNDHGVEICHVKSLLEQ
jgi:hypothetical protein